MSDAIRTESDANSLRIHLDVIAWLKQQRSRVPDDRSTLPNGTRVGPDPRVAYDKAIDLVSEALGDLGRVTLGPIPFPPQPSPPPPPPSASPQEVLDQIVAGINAAESRLNDQSLVITGGNVEAKLNLPVAGVTISFSIGPKPYH